MDHDGRAYSLTIPDLEILECADCHARSLPDKAHDILVAALRTKAGLLAPNEIREKRLGLGLTQEQLAKHLKVAKETVCRWETGGQIQQRAMDMLLRLYFDVADARTYLASDGSTRMTPDAANTETHAMVSS
jgi:DNA-binding transcriptional regulator YiaG